MADVKILISPGYGAGWVSWNYETAEQRMFMLTYKPFIRDIENAGSVREATIESFETEFEAKFGAETAPYTGGVDNLVVRVYPRGTWLKVCEYDGSEYVITEKTIRDEGLQLPAGQGEGE